jgi:ring-1,2-phenylacetyl-CoA epoxidase subunit PaaC
MQPIVQYLLRIADNTTILSQRLSEWCGHGPILEQDIALTNIALDLIGQSRLWYTLAGELEGKGRSEDDLAFLRDGWDYYNVLLVEQPNGDWAHTIARQFFFDSWHQPYLEALTQSQHERIAEIAAKSLKEVQYHLRFSSEWMIRMGDGTEESHQRAQKAVDELYRFSGELCLADALDTDMAAQGTGPDLTLIQQQQNATIHQILGEATLQLPEKAFQQTGGKQGRHSEHLGYILTDMQFMQRAYPGLSW